MRQVSRDRCVFCKAWRTSAWICWVHMGFGVPKDAPVGEPSRKEKARAGGGTPGSPELLSWDGRILQVEQRYERGC
jgi:hypothetical protein